jgi:hypothetical protein
MDDFIAYQTVVALNVSRLSGKEYKERGRSLNSEKTILNYFFSKLKMKGEKHETARAYNC